MKPLVIAVCFATVLPLAVLAQPLDLKGSSISATFQQMNVPVAAPFRQFKGDIHYDPAQPSAGTASIEVETASFDMGDKEYNAEVAKKTWFDSAAFPTASFTSTKIVKLGADKIEVDGSLIIKGKSQSVSLPVTISKQAGQTAYDGSLAISRAYFGIGDASWNDVVDDKVSLKFHLLAVN